MDGKLSSKIEDEVTSVIEAEESGLLPTVSPHATCSTAARSFCCPGDAIPISWSLHLGRLAAGYAACRDCVHQHETGTLPGVVLDQLERFVQSPFSANPSVDSSSPGDQPSAVHAQQRLENSARFVNLQPSTGSSPRLTQAGNQVGSNWLQSPALPGILHHLTIKASGVPRRIRGLYHNELTRPGIVDIVERILERAMLARFSAVLANGSHMHNDRANRACDPVQQRAPLRVVTGYDWRFSSPDLAVGVIEVLRRAGCETLDVGQTSRSCFDFSLARIPVDLGLFVTGGVAGETWNGLDVLDGDGSEWGAPGKLEEVWQSRTFPVSRWNRSSGTYRALSATVHYEQELAREFQLVGPLKVALACVEPAALQFLGHQLLNAGCEVRFLNWNDRGDQDLKRWDDFRTEIRQSHVDVGFWIGGDGQTILVFDERGRLLPPDVTLALTSGSTTEAYHDSHTVEQTHRKQGRFRLSAKHEEDAPHADAGQLPHAITDHLGRYWYAERTPHCDAAHVVTGILNALSLSNWPLSGLAKQQIPSESS